MIYLKTLCSKRKKHPFERFFLIDTKVTCKKVQPVTLICLKRRHSSLCNSFCLSLCFDSVALALHHNQRPPAGIYSLFPNKTLQMYSGGVTRSFPSAKSISAGWKHQQIKSMLPNVSIMIHFCNKEHTCW